MSSTIRSTTSPKQPQPLSVGSLRWRNWPLVDHPRWSWIVPLAILAAGAWVYMAGGSVALAAAVVVAFALALRSFLLPAWYEITSLGLQRLFARRVRLFPWQTVRAYQPRATGVLLFQHPEPTPLDLARSVFVPYPEDSDELLAALKLNLPHATEARR